jgi:hypothetical protein
MSDVKAPTTKPAQAESIIGCEDNLTPILLFLAAIAVITVFTFGYVCYCAEKTNERLERLEKLNGIEQLREPCGCCPLGVLPGKESEIAKINREIAGAW